MLRNPAVFLGWIRWRRHAGTNGPPIRTTSVLRWRTSCVFRMHTVIIGGSDEEFSSFADTSKLPKLASKILEERTAKLDDTLSLATVWFKCGLCYFLIAGTSAQRHRCQTARDWLTGKPVGPTFDIQTLKRRGKWDKKFRFTFSATALNLARGLILDCGEDPRMITLAEMNLKFHRFASNESGGLLIHNWREAVSFTSLFIRVRYHGLTNHGTAPRPV